MLLLLFRLPPGSPRGPQLLLELHDVDLRLILDLMLEFLLALHLHTIRTYSLARRIVLKPLRGRCRAPAHAPLIAASLLKPLPRAHIQIAVQLRRRLLPVNEVAEAAADAALAAVEATARFSEIGDGRQLAVDGATGVPARVERVAGFLRVFFVLEAHVDVADEVC